MLDYGEAHEFLKSLGFTFTYDKSDSNRTCFSVILMFFGKARQGIWCYALSQDGFVHQFSYNGFQPAQEFKNFVTDYITGLKQKFIEQKKKELEQDFEK